MEMGGCNGGWNGVCCSEKAGETLGFSKIVKEEF
jgi:hypothetical protein